MSNNFEDEYKLIEFNKNNLNLLDILLKYYKKNCRDELDKNYVSTCLKNTDIGFSFYVKNVPFGFGFVCINIMNSEELHISIICTVKTNNNLGSKLLNIVFQHAKQNNYKLITLECDEKLEIFYKKFGFFMTNKLGLDFIDMAKNIK